MSPCSAIVIVLVSLLGVILAKENNAENNVEKSSPGK